MKNSHTTEKIPEWFRELSEEEKKVKIRRLRLEDNNLLKFDYLDKIL